MNRTLLPAILLIVAVIAIISGYPLYQQNNQITKLNNSVTELTKGQLPVMKIQGKYLQGLATTTKP
jgi:hypothetical protein